VMLDAWSGINHQRKPLTGNNRDIEREALRLHEYDKPADISGTKTVNQVIDEASGKSKGGVGFDREKMRNYKIDHMRYDLGFKMVRHLSIFALPQKSSSIDGMYGNSNPVQSVKSHL
jgi:hypothetical protein